MAKLLFASKREWPDIQVEIAFLTKRVTNHDEDNWKKLMMLLSYIKSAPDIILALLIEKFNSVKWWVDASCTVHPNTRSHTRDTITLEKGLIFSTSCKQKIHTQSSMEA